MQTDPQVATHVMLTITEYRHLLRDTWTTPDLVAIKDAVKNALDNSKDWTIQNPHPDCECADWKGCTVLDVRDAAELRAAMEGKVE